MIVMRKRFRLFILFVILAFSLWNASLWTILLVAVNGDNEQVTPPPVTAVSLLDTYSSSSYYSINATNEINNDNHNDTETLLAQGTAMALRIATNDFPPTTIPQPPLSSTNNTPTAIGPIPIWQTAAEWSMDVSQLVGQCDIVYSFGVGTNDPWTNLMAHYCKRVYAFDPTISNYDANPNVTFFPWGLLRNTNNNNNNNNNNATTNMSSSAWSHPIYGSAVPEAIFLTFPQIQARLSLLEKESSSSSSSSSMGEENQSPPPPILSAIKFDCEGCEYGVFAMGQVPPPTKLLYIEFHFAMTLGMQTKQDVIALSVMSTYLSHCTVHQFRPNRGFRRDRQVLPYLVEQGIPDGICCYEYGFTCHFG